MSKRETGAPETPHETEQTRAARSRAMRQALEDDMVSREGVYRRLAATERPGGVADGS